MPPWLPLRGSFRGFRGFRAWGFGVRFVSAIPLNPKGRSPKLNNPKPSSLRPLIVYIYTYTHYIYIYTIYIHIYIYLDMHTLYIYTHTIYIHTHTQGDPKLQLSLDSFRMWGHRM